MQLTTAALLGAALLTLATLACGLSATESYVREIESVLQPVEAKVDEWYALQVRFNLLLNESNYEVANEAVRDMYSVAEESHAIAKESLDTLESMVPPEQCTQAHLVVIELVDLTSSYFLMQRIVMSDWLDRDRIDEEHMSMAKQILEEAVQADRRSESLLMDCK